ncbi:putative GDSL-like lipase/acylhydrolase [Actinoplanes missouriensis 431]|uniref:Putative GDSL-like lipase/acylhydrolase n=2 Tax=Actinoplanes missouriensis TaxID=1866 RepID=I0H537_ACTM4|nr:putative GDSL-like lipase/acylhydrolase [Actinoplanes missouriensis 431]
MMSEATDPDVLSPTQAAKILSGAVWKRFAVFGDSLSLGVGDATPGYGDLGWPSRVEQALRQVQPGLAYLNTARVGATTAQALAEQADRIADFGPDLLHLNSGANDIIRRSLDWGRIENDLRTMYAWASSTGARLSVFTLGRAFTVGIPGFTDRVARLNDITRALAAEYDVTVADCWDHPLNDRPGLVSRDGIHFAAMGQAIIAGVLVEALGKRLVAR